MFEIRANMWSTENSRFCEKYIEKQPKISQNGLFSAVFWSKWQDSNLRSHRPERCAIPPSLHLDVVKIFDFFVSGQTCGQTEELMIFRHSGEPKKSVFSRVFGSSRKFYVENGDWDPNVALYQAEPHLDIGFCKDGEKEYWIVFYFVGGRWRQERRFCGANGTHLVARGVPAAKFILL